MIIINRDTYSEFIKDEKKLQSILHHDEVTSRISQILYVLKYYLENYKITDEIKNYSIKGNRIEVDTEKYIICMLVLHTGDVCQYTINKKTKHKGNYNRRMNPVAVMETLNKYIF